MSDIQKHNIMADVHIRMYYYCMELANKTDEREKKLSLACEAEDHLSIANHHTLMSRVCGNEFVSIR